MPYLPQYSSAFHSKLHGFRFDQKYCDINIQVEETCFKCHRVVLASVSEYFDIMFGGHFMESNVDDIILHDICSATFDDILTYAYTGVLSITEQNVFNLLRAGEFLRIVEIPEHCVEYIQEHIPAIENIFDVFVFASTTHKHSLVEKLSQYIAKHFASLYKNNDFLRMSFNDLIIILNLYQLPAIGDLLCRDENVTLDAIVRWVYHARQDRGQYFGELVKLVNFENISSQFLEFMMKEYVNRVENIALPTARPDFPSSKHKLALKRYLIDLIVSKGSIDNNALPVSCSDPQFSKNRLSLYVYVAFRRDRLTRVFSINRFESDWRVSCVIEPKPDSVKCISLDNFNCLYCLDCRSSSQIFRACGSVDISSVISRLLKPPPLELREFEMCSVKNSIYLYDSDIHFIKSRIPDLKKTPKIGFNEEELTRGIYMYNVEIDKWLPVPAMRENLSESCMTSHNNLVYLIGGKNVNNEFPVGYVQAYDYRTPRWMELPRTNKPYYNAACCVHNGKIYISGDWVAEAFNPIAGKWETITRMIRKRHGHRLISYENRLWAIGNEGRYFSNAFIEIYDTIFQKWSTSKLLDKAIGKHLSDQDMECDSVEYFPRTTIQDVIVFKDF